MRIDVVLRYVGIVMLFIAAFTFRRKAIPRWEGVLFLLIYIVYIWQTVRERSSNRGRAYSPTVGAGTANRAACGVRTGVSMR